MGRAAERAGRLDAARGLLRRLEDRSERPAAEPGAHARVLPVVPPLAGLLAGDGLRRGTTVAIGSGTATSPAEATGTGATSLLLALLAGASAAGAWVGVVGRPELGLVAAAEAGVALERLALVPYPGADLLAVTAALLDGLDVVAVSWSSLRPAAVGPGDRQRLAARARQRGAVLVPLGPWPGADVELACTPDGWQGVRAGDTDGGGRLRARRMRVQVGGRGVAPGGREATLLLPGPDGRPATVPDPAVTRLQEAG